MPPEQEPAAPLASPVVDDAVMEDAAVELEEELPPPPLPAVASAKRELEKPVLLLTASVCPEGHPLVRTTVSRAVQAVQGDTLCDECARVIEVRAQSHHCSICCFDLCVLCARAKRARARL